MNFILESTETKPLSNLGLDKIVITSISSTSDIQTLFCPIEVLFNDPKSGKFSKRFIHASQYFSNKKHGISTDLPMYEIITSCSKTSLKINNIQNLPPFKFQINYHELVNIIDTLTIYVNNQSEGRTYSLHPKSKELVREKFPGARPAGQLYTSYENEFNYTLQHGDIHKPFVQGMTNLTDAELLQIGKIQFIDSKTNSLITEISFDNE